MSSTGQVQDFSDLYKDLMIRMRDISDDANLIVVAKRLVNTALHDIIISDKYEWGKRFATLVTQPSYSTGTVAVSRGSTAVVGTSTAWATTNDMGIANARAGGKMKLGGEVYEVSSVTDATNIVLASKFTRTTLASGSSYTYFEDEYDPESDFDEIISSYRMIGDIEVPIVHNDKFHRAFVRNDVVGQPQIATVIDRAFGSSTARVQKIVLAPSPNDFYSLRYKYSTKFLATSSAGVEQTQLVEDSDEPIIPLKYRHSIVLHALKMGFLTRKDDQRSQQLGAEYNELIQRMKVDTGAADPQPKLQITRPSTTYWGRGRRKSGRFSTGTEFEDLRL